MKEIKYVWVVEGEEGEDVSWIDTIFADEKDAQIEMDRLNKEYKQHSTVYFVEKYPIK